MASGREAWITGIGLVSCHGRDVAEHKKALAGGIGLHSTVLDCDSFAPACVHPLAPIEFSEQIRSKNDLRQMGRWQQIGVYAAGLALTDGAIDGQPDLLDQTDIVAAAGNGERDTELDERILANATVVASEASELCGSTILNEALQTGLRPTLYLGELSNLLAGNIQIVHNVTGSSRTLKGEEMAGVLAVENAVRRVAAGQAEVVLVGGALNAEREDLLLGYELGCNLCLAAICGRIPISRFGSASRPAAASSRAAPVPSSSSNRAITQRRAVQRRTRRCAASPQTGRGARSRARSAKALRRCSAR